MPIAFKRKTNWGKILQRANIRTPRFLMVSEEGKDLLATPYLSDRCRSLPFGLRLTGLPPPKSRRSGLPTLCCRSIIIFLVVTRRLEGQLLVPLSTCCVSEVSRNYNRVDSSRIAQFLDECNEKQRRHRHLNNQG